MVRRLVQAKSLVPKRRECGKWLKLEDFADGKKTNFGAFCSQNVPKTVFGQKKGAAIFIATPFVVIGSGARI